MNGETVSRKQLLLTATGGLAGALLMFAGDMLLYGHWGSGAGFSGRYTQVIAGASTLRLYLAGALGPVAAILYLAGARHLWLRLRPARPFLRTLTSLTFVATFVIAGAVHAVWGAYALVLRALAHGQANKSVEDVMSSYLDSVYTMAEVVGYPAAVLLFILTIAGRTTYPRWAAFLNPGLIMLAAPLAKFLPAPIGAPVVGGLFNLAFVVFFVMSLATARRAQYNGR